MPKIPKFSRIVGDKLAKNSGTKWLHPFKLFILSFCFCFYVFLLFLFVYIFKWFDLFVFFVFYRAAQNGYTLLRNGYTISPAVPNGYTGWR